jgi:NAD(P)H-dependent flavin oxidoreductase YrpB (nitropropane dioxygenase family)
MKRSEARRRRVVKQFFNRKGTEKMEVEFTKAATGMMFRMLHNPQTLAPDQPYKAADSIGATEIIALQYWVINKPDLAANIAKEGQLAQYECKAWRGKMKESFVKRLKDVAEHYKGAGRLVNNCEGYENLLTALKGEKVVIEPVEE